MSETSKWKKNAPTVLVVLALVLLVILILAPVFTISILALIGFGYLLYRKPTLRIRLKTASIKTGRILGVYAINHKKTVAVIAIVLFVTASVFRMYVSAAPVIVLKDSYDFIGDEVAVNGQVKADCRCSIQATLNDKPIELLPDGTFNFALTVPPEQNGGSIIVKAEAKPLHLSLKVQNSVATTTFSRKEALIEVSGAPSESSNAKVQLSLHGLPNASITVKGSSETNAILNTDGSGTVVVPFNTTYNIEANSYTIITKVEGYAEGKKTVSIKNLKYDARRTAKEEDAKKFKEMAAKARDDMQTYTGGDDVKIAINPDILVSNCVGYSCVTDSKSAKFVRIGISVKNFGDSAIYVNPNYVTLQETNGYTAVPDTSTYGLSNYLDSVRVQPGGYTAGWLSFIVSRSEQVFTLIYSSPDGSVAKPILIQ